MLTAETYLALGLDRLTPTHDLNAEQIATLARQLEHDQIEVVAYHHLPVFHTEHCVFCRFLSTGTSYRDCGRPCEKHVVALRDQQGRAHPVMADVGLPQHGFRRGGAAGEPAPGIMASRRAFATSASNSHTRPETQVERVTRAFESALAGRVSSFATRRGMEARGAGRHH